MDQKLTKTSSKYCPHDSWMDQKRTWCGPKMDQKWIKMNQKWTKNESKWTKNRPIVDLNFFKILSTWFMNAPLRKLTKTPFRNKTWLSETFLGQISALISIFSQIIFASFSVKTFTAFWCSSFSTNFSTKKYFACIWHIFFANVFDISSMFNTKR